MAISCAEKLFICLSLFVITCYVDSYRYGLKANNLHIPAQSIEERFGVRTRIIEADISKFSQDSSYERHRRSTEKHTSSSNYSTVTQLNDSHTQMIVHWAGEGSDVIIALSRDSRTGASTSSSLFISTDYGKSFVNVTDRLTIITGEKVIIDHYYNSKVLNSHYVFADITNNYIFTTTDYGRNFRTVHVQFKPKTISIHPSNPQIILGMDEDDPRKRLYVSKDFGVSWRMMQEGVKSFFWGKEKLDKPDDIYIERQQMDQGSSVLKSSDFFIRDIHQLIVDGDDFQMIGQYMFATKKLRLLGSTNTTLQLWVSYNRGPFKNAQFGNDQTRLDYYIADASEEQVFLCVTNNKSGIDVTHLYISDITGTKYSLSLENVIYYNPKGSHKNTWLKYFAHDPFADVTKLGALRGVYIANQQTNTTFSLENQRSVITFDKGGEWVPLRAPQKDLTGQLANCSQSTNCSLHLTQEFSRLYPGSRSSAIMSKKSAPGLVLGMGVTGTSLKHDPDMFVSSDAGYTWRPVLEGNQYYAMGDHGGLIISVPQFRTTNVMYYSWNEGETWRAYTFHPEKIRVYGILTEPGEMTSIFTLFGSHASRHRWLIIQIDLHSIFQYSCNEDDYKMWSFPDQKPYFGCILGKKTVYERRIAHAECYNGRDYDRQIIEKNCTCTREDFECDLGFMEDNSFHSFTPTCKEDPLFHLDLHKPPVPCPEGTYYPYSKGYRRISGDTCHGGSEYRYAPYMLSCPVGESTEFLLYSSRHFVRRYVFGSSQDESIVDINRADVGGSIYAVAFDYRENMVYWSQGSPNKIMKVSLKGASNISTVAEGRGMSTVESLVFDWTGGNLYWIDSINKSIEVARKTGEFRRVLVDSTHLDRPRGLVLDPHFGWMYWTDWSRSNPRIMKAAMDGNVTSIQVIVSGSTHVYWPNGITIDHRDMKIYWTDAHLDRISSANFDGSGIRLIVRGTYYAPHPYAIGIYKDRIFWSDWMKNAIFSADKHTGRGIITVKANISDVMDLKILDYLSQNGQTACSRSNGGCSELCLPKPGYEPTTKNRTCKCDGLMPRLTISHDGNEKCECVTGERMVNNKCVPDAGSSNCTAGRYKCRNGDCIPATWVCDHDNDCSDGSEEMNCPYASCRSGSFQCGNGRCIPGRWQCDFDNDCGDNSDENGCHYPACASDKHTCANGRCINRNWTCDFDDDCRDGSDEVNCSYSEVCSDEEFHCLKHQPKCIAMSRRCDGIRDCTDNSDERNCTHNSTMCSVNQFSCENNGRCIYMTWRCDGDRDCTDGSDETNCTMTTTPRPTIPSSIAPGTCHFWQFQCHNGHCVWWSNRCDHNKDCGDNSDELNCGFSTTTPAPCNWNQFLCGNGQCISKEKKCDGSEDCYDGSDEMGCYECIGEEFRCNTSACIPQSSVCDGYHDCIHGDDELHCEGHQGCTSNHFKCYSSGECILMTSLCDGSFDCADHSDETGVDCRNGTVKPVTCPNEYKCYSDDSCQPWMFVCDGVGQCVYREDENRCGDRSLAPSVRLLSVSGRNMTISWRLVYSTPGKDASYIVSYMDKNHVTKNVTSKTNMCTLTDLKPLTAYDVTVYLVTNSTINRPHSRQHFITTEAEPDPPTKVKATINIGYITVQWIAPSSANGQILEYKIYCYETKTKTVSTKMVVNMDDTKMATIVPNTLQYGDTYRVWVTAFTQTGEGKPSKNSTVTYNTERITKKPTGFSLKKGNDTCVDLSWDKMTDKDVQDYKISFTDAWNVEQEISVPEDITKHRVCDLCPTEKYIFYICASNNHGKGPEDTIGYRPGDYVYHNQRYIPTWPKLKPQSIDSGKYKVVWNKPQNSPSSINLGYTLFYDYRPADMEGNMFATKAFKKVVNTQTYTVISSIQACESYLLKVAVSKPGRCPPSLPFTMQTGEDDKAQPEILIAKFPKPTSVVISWTAGCYDPSAALAYILKITNDKTNHSHLYQTKATNNLTISHRINGLERGANYSFQVKTNVNNGRWSELLHLEALKYGAPEDFKEVLMKDGKIQLSWNPPQGQDKYHVHQYEIYMRRLKSAKDKGGFELYKTVDKTTRNVSINTDPSIMYSFQIRIISDKGYPGFYADEPSQSIPKSEGQTGKSDINISRTRMIAIIVSVTGVVIALVLVLGFFIIRHRRLQRSFLAFANSHYDTRSGTTTFESNELGEEEDSPMIQGFSDDEPLVIA